MINLILIWSLSYFLWFILVIFLVYSKQITFQLILACHVLLLVSIIFSFYFLHKRGLLELFLSFHPYSPVLFLLILVFLAHVILTKMSFAYSLSVVIQQVTMYSISFLLFSGGLSTFGVWFLVALPFVLAHKYKSPHTFLKAFLLLLWGTLCIFLYSLEVNIFYISILHFVGGVVLIRSNLILNYERTTAG